jgi:hypothetical protein
MMSLQSIIAVNQEIAAEAAQQGLVPYVPLLRPKNNSVFGASGLC